MTQESLNFNGPYHNSTNLSGSALETAQEVTGRQERTVAEIFKANRILSPSLVMALYPDKSVPITSIRRAISNLTRRGVLYKTHEKCEGEYGRPEYIWRVVP